MQKQIVRCASEIIKKAEKGLRVSHEKHLSIQETGYYSNKPVTIDSRNNEIANQVLESGKISITDPNLSFKTVDLNTVSTLGPEYIQTDLGETKIYSNHQILLEDVDPRNIPADKDIIFWAKTAKIVAIGQPCAEINSKNIEQSMFHEEKARHGVGYTWKTYLKLLPLVPVFFYLAVYLEVVREYYYVNSFYTALDRENMELLKQLKCSAHSTLSTQKLMLKFYPDNE